MILRGPFLDPASHDIFLTCHPPLSRPIVPLIVPLCSYIEFSAIAAKCVRNSLKGGEAIEAAAKRSTGVVQVKHYADGVAGTPSTLCHCAFHPVSCTTFLTMPLLPTLCCAWSTM